MVHDCCTIRCTHTAIYNHHSDCTGSKCRFVWEQCLSTLFLTQRTYVHKHTHTHIQTHRYLQQCNYVCGSFVHVMMPASAHIWIFVFYGLRGREGVSLWHTFIRLSQSLTHHKTADLRHWLSSALYLHEFMQVPLAETPQRSFRPECSLLMGVVHNVQCVTCTLYNMHTVLHTLCVTCTLCNMHSV